MRYVNTNEEGLLAPGTSITGDHTDTLLDTGWDVHLEGPGRIYLSARDLVDVVVPALESEAVQDALKKNGWTAPDGTADEVAELKQQLEETQQELANAKIAEAGFDAAVKKLEAKASRSHKKAA